jgi:hypothetical protein
MTFTTRFTNEEETVAFLKEISRDAKAISLKEISRDAKAISSAF